MCQRFIDGCVGLALFTLNNFPLVVRDFGQRWLLVESLHAFCNGHAECGCNLAKCGQGRSDAKVLDFRKPASRQSTASRGIFKRELPVQPVLADTLREFNEVHVLFH